MGHQEIYDNVQQMQPGTMHSHAKKWLDIAAGLGGSLFGLNISIQSALSEGIQGQLADAGAAAARTFVAQGTAIQEVIEAVGARIHAAAYGAEAVKGSVPAPKPATTGTTSAPAANLVIQAIPGAPDPAKVTGDGKDEAALYEDAKAAMKLNYNTTYMPAGEQVPTFVPVDHTGPTGPDNGPSPSGNELNNSGKPGGTRPPDETNPDDSTDKSDPNTAQQTDPANASQSGQDSSRTGSQSTSNPATSSASGSDTRPSGLDSTNAAGYGGGGPGSGLGSYGTHGGSGTAQPGGPGRSAPGVTSGGNPAAAASFGTRPGQPGLGGMPGMGGAGKKDETEREHKTPDYLIMDREEELLGLRDRTLPGAIGADIPSAQFGSDDEGRRP
ncbi:hypothetical protein C5E45_18255 [Nocardia nova]|uniref:PPE domain-containing protein n=1 Tax=Nocardia nova TaxID=37330 RepID=A0A2S6ANG1_9NOCA|nr:hypothetical protein C5E45_18255 [Nocardia nova]